MATGYRLPRLRKTHGVAGYHLPRLRTKRGLAGVARQRATTASAQGLRRAVTHIVSSAARPSCGRSLQ